MRNDPKHRRNVAHEPGEISRRDVLRGAAAGAGVGALVGVARPDSAHATPARGGGPSSPAAALPAAFVVRLSVNGAAHSIEPHPFATLLDALRDHLNLQGTKKGCAAGSCGACTVLLEGRRVKSCLALAAACEGQEITTIEGLADGERLNPLQQAFVECDAFQCGYCTPGQIMSAAGYLAERHEDPTNLDVIREQMSGNICRCGAYPNIVTAIARVAAGPQ